MTYLGFASTTVLLDCELLTKKANGLASPQVTG